MLKIAIRQDCNIGFDRKAKRDEIIQTTDKKLNLHRQNYNFFGFLVCYKTCFTFMSSTADIRLYLHEHEVLTDNDLS